jgi:hypothetical protein
MSVFPAFSDCHSALNIPIIFEQSLANNTTATAATTTTAATTATSATTATAANTATAASAATAQSTTADPDQVWIGEWGSDEQRGQSLVRHSIC